MEKAREEAETVMFDCIAKTLKKAGVRPNQVSQIRITTKLAGPCSFETSLQFGADSLCVGI